MGRKRERGVRRVRNIVIRIFWEDGIKQWGSGDQERKLKGLYTVYEVEFPP